MRNVTFATYGQIVYWISMLSGFVAASWIAIRRRRYVRTVLGYGLLWSIPILLAEVAFLAACVSAWENEKGKSLDISFERDTILLESIISVPCKFVGSVLFVVSGMYLAARSGRACLPLLRAASRRRKAAGRRILATDSWPILGEAILVAVFCYSYTIFIFAVGKPHESEEIKKLVDAIGQGTAENLLFFKGLVSAPLFEEIVFRHFLQRALGRILGGRPDSRAAAVFLASLFWSLGHAGVVSPEWVKLAQTLPLGLALGWLYERRGLESSVLAHFLFNGVSAILMAQSR